MKAKKWLKRIGIGCLAIVTIFFAIIIFLVVNDLKSEKKLDQEIEEIQNILNHFKKIVSIRKEHPALQEDGEFKIISKESYPAVYERSLGDEKIQVIINPSVNEYSLTNIKAEEVYITHNITFDNEAVNIGKCAYAVYRVE